MSKKRYGERLDRSKFLTGTYYLAHYAQTEENAKRLSDAKIDFVVREKYSKKLLDVLNQQNIGAFPIGIVPQERKIYYLDDQIPIGNYIKARDAYEDHPAVYGPFIGWRSNMMNFEHYGTLIKAAKEFFPGTLPFFSLTSSYPEDMENGKNAPISIHGTFDYEEYVKEYVDQIDLDYICFEHYPYVSNVARFLQNFEIIADKCRESGRDLWATIQVTNRNPAFHAMTVTNAKMQRFQAYTALAFGAKTIIWSTWTKGWWDTCVIDEFGNPTKLYDRFCKINAEVKKMGEAMFEYDNKSTHFLGYRGTPYLTYTKKKAENGIDLGEFKNVTLAKGNATVGYFEKDGGCGIMISDASDPYDDGYVYTEITFECEKAPKAICNGEEITLEKRDGKYVVPVSECCGTFVTVEF